MKIRFTLFAVFALFFATFTNSVSAQTEYSTSPSDQGCGSLPADYRFPPRTYIWKKADDGKMELLPIDQVNLTGSKMVFTFRPDPESQKHGREPFKKGNPIRLEVFPYGRETSLKLDSNSNLVSYLHNPDAIKNLGLPIENEVKQFQEKVKNDPAFAKKLQDNPNLGVFKVSNLHDEQYLVLDWDEKALAEIKDIENGWYAILHPIGPFEKSLPPEYARKEKGGLTPYISPIPIENLEQSLNEGEVTTSLIPPTYYSFENKPQNLDKTNYIENQKLILEPKAKLRKLKSLGSLTSENGRIFLKRTLELDTTNLEGEYWVTLQGTAVFDGQSPRQCSKTTPPVLIKIEPPPPPNTYPELTLVSTVVCNPFIAEVVATASDKDVPAQKLTIKDWKIFESNYPNQKEIPLPAGYEIINNSDKSQTLKINGGLKVGKYTVEATVFDGIDYTREKTEFEVKDCPPHTGKAAGIAYFGNATPNYRKGEIITNPEEWTKDTERKRPVRAGRYPSKEFEKFYIVTTKPGESPIIPTLKPESNNTDTINRIVDELQKYPGSNLYILGYADYRFTPRVYSNEELAEFRVKSVVKAIEEELRRRNLPNKIIGAGSTAINCGDDTAVVNKKLDIWDDILRWDRRVEIIYVYGNEIRKLPSYAEKCRVLQIDLTR